MAKQTIGEFLATLRKANGYTQQDIADRLGISNRTLSGWECDNVLPDILLLPALAELYGVTVDEMLAGERKEKSEVELTTKAGKRVLRNKLMHFTSHCYLLVGLMILGVLLVASCALVPESIWGMYESFWWFSLIAGSILMAVCITIIFSLWKGAELFVEDRGEEYRSYGIILRKRFANCLYVVAAVCAVLAVAVADFLFVRYKLIDAQLEKGTAVFVCIAFACVAVAFFTTGWLLYKNALTKHGEEATQQSVKKDRHYFAKVGIWCSIPLVLSVILAIVMNCVHYEKKTTMYQNDDVGEFVRYMESIRDTQKEHYFPLSELAKTAQRGDKFELGDGYVGVYEGSIFQIRNDNYLMVDGRGSELIVTRFVVDVPRIYLIDNGQSISFYNLRYWKHYDEGVFSINQVTPNIRAENYRFERQGNGWAYVHIFTRDYAAIGNSVACSVIVVDLIVFAALCVAKRNKFPVKL